MLEKIKDDLKSIRLARNINSEIRGRILDCVSQFDRIRFGDIFKRTNFSDCEQITRKLLKSRRICRVAKFSGRKNLNIFFLGSYYDHESQGFLQALQRLGRLNIYTNLWGTYGISPPADIIPTPQEYIQSGRHLYDSICKSHAEQPIDFVIGTLTAPKISLQTLLPIRSLGIPILNIAMDDMLPEHWKKRGGAQMGAFGLAPAIDLTLQTTRNLISRYLAAGFPAIYFPFASDPEIFYPEREKTIDVLFVGNCYGKRERLIDALTAADIRVDAYGSGFSNGHIAGDHVPRLFGRSKIVLGSGLVGHSGKLATLKLRDFDAPMSGALYITSENPDLKNHFKIGSEIIIYTSTKDCIRKVKYFLDNETERIRIAAAGRERAIAEHTWDLRLADAMRVMEIE